MIQEHYEDFFMAAPDHFKFISYSCFKIPKRTVRHLDALVLNRHRSSQKQLRRRHSM